MCVCVCRSKEAYEHMDGNCDEHDSGHQSRDQAIVAPRARDHAIIATDRQPYTDIPSTRRWIARPRVVCVCVFGARARGGAIYDVPARTDLLRSCK